MCWCTQNLWCTCTNSSIFYKRGLLLKLPYVLICTCEHVLEICTSIRSTCVYYTQKRWVHMVLPTCPVMCGRSTYMACMSVIHLYVLYKWLVYQFYQLKITMSVYLWTTVKCETFIACFMSFSQDKFSPIIRVKDVFLIMINLFKH